MRNKKILILKILSLVLISVLFFCRFDVIRVQCAELNANIKCGDIDKSGDINISDGVILKKYLAHMADATVDKAVGDVNVDGEIDVSDAVILMKYLAGMNVKLGADSETPIIPETGNKKLVVYFSATNTTKRLAQELADGIDADLYEIVPEIPYTSADLNYGNSSSRTSIEMNDPNARPAISGSVENMQQYNIVFIGYPIWLAYHNLIQCTQA